MLIRVGKNEIDQIEKKKVSYDQLDKIIQAQLVGGPDKQVATLPEPRGWDQTDSVLIECEGFWWLDSKVDPRWNAEGKAIVGGKSMCPEAKRAFLVKKEKLGSKVPWDLKYRFEPLNLRKFRLAGEKKSL